MKSLPWRPGSRAAADANPSHAIPTPRRAPTWPGETVINEHPFWAPIPDEIPSGLPAEDRNLLTAYPVQTGTAARGFLGALALAAVLQRPPCRILAVSRDETAARGRFDFEVAVGQNLAMLADQDHMTVTR